MLAPTPYGSISMENKTLKTLHKELCAAQSAGKFIDLVINPKAIIIFFAPGTPQKTLTKLITYIQKHFDQHIQEIYSTSTNTIKIYLHDKSR